MKTGIVYDPAYMEHRQRGRHPECPERCEAVMQGIRDTVPAAKLLAIVPRPATESEVELCHDGAYVDLVRQETQDGYDTLTTGDTDVCEKSYRVALLAAGGVLAAVDAVMAGTVCNAFCCVRPPGHHATPDRGMGFCIFNNAAIGARYAQVRHGIERVLIVDWDIHHGNGTQEIFYGDPTVFYFSTHQWPFYPGTGIAAETGTGKGKGTTLNCPLPARSGRREVTAAFRESLVPAMDSFKPQFVVISAGFDAMELDTIGTFTLTADDFADLTRLVMQIAEKHAGGRIVSVLEGGYRLPGLAAAAGAHVKALAGAAR